MGGGSGGGAYTPPPAPWNLEGQADWNAAGNTRVFGPDEAVNYYNLQRAVNNYGTKLVFNPVGGNEVMRETDPSNANHVYILFGSMANINGRG